ncbi:hypothetical protein KJ691_02860 [bacterium]|nr:hypothetical protein [bacterium]
MKYIYVLIAASFFVSCSDENSKKTTTQIVNHKSVSETTEKKEVFCKNKENCIKCKGKFE